jgi:sulfatase maturation enzyme AslB (radical SAM superfamily)
VEVTSRCNAVCSYCPRTVYRDAWLNRNLWLEAFKRLSLAFTKTKMVFLQGWGEPFLNSELMAMVRIAKEAACKVGTTTNGMLLNEEIIYQLVECGMDVLAFSLAGVDEKNDGLRRGTSLDTILEAIRILHETKKNLGKELPAVHIAYILLRSRIGDIERLPLFLQGLPVRQVVVSTLDFVPCIVRFSGVKRLFFPRVYGESEAALYSRLHLAYHPSMPIAVGSRPFVEK